MFAQTKRNEICPVCEGKNPDSNRCELCDNAGTVDVTEAFAGRVAGLRWRVNSDGTKTLQQCIVIARMVGQRMLPVRTQWQDVMDDFTGTTEL